MSVIWTPVILIMSHLYLKVTHESGNIFNYALKAMSKKILFGSKEMMSSVNVNVLTREAQPSQGVRASARKSAIGNHSILQE